MPKRRRLRVSCSPEGESERPATGHGQPRPLGHKTMAIQSRAQSIPASGPPGPQRASTLLVTAGSSSTGGA